MHSLSIKMMRLSNLERVLHLFLYVFAILSLSCSVGNTLDFSSAWDFYRRPQFISNVYSLNDGLYPSYFLQKTLTKGSIFKTSPVFTLATVKSDVTIPIYDLERGGAHLYTTSQEERSGALRRGFVDREILGFVFKDPAAGLVPLYSWRDAKTEATLLGLEKESREARGFDPKGILGYVFQAEQPFRIGVYYLGMFSPRAWESGLSRNRTNILRLYGDAAKDRFWWAGVRDLQQENAPPALLKEFPQAAAYFNQDWRGYQPIIGWYDQSDPRTLERHINQATSNGISYFNFYWYWDFLLEQEGVNDGLDSFLTARNSNQIDFMLSVCEHGWHFTLPQRDFDEVTKLIVTKYLSRENYLMTPDGRLLFEICDPKGIRTEADTNTPRGYQMQDVAALREFVTTLRRRVKSQLGRDLLVTTTAPDERIMNDAGLDGGTCVTSALEHPELGQNDRLVNWLDKAAKAAPYLPCVTERFDERPRVGIIKPPAKIMFDRHPVLPSSFGTELREAKEWMEKRSNDDLSRFLVIYAWNEWHEGGVLEPSIQSGAAFINQIPIVFQIPFVDIKCRTSGLCPDAEGRQ